jgi:hypothetical protein
VRVRGIVDAGMLYEVLSATTNLAEDPFSGQLFIFRGRRGDRVKVLWWDVNDSNLWPGIILRFLEKLTKTPIRVSPGARLSAADIGFEFQR